MTDEQKEHYSLLMLTNGGRQYGGSPFDMTNWLPYVTSNYGYRIHPITGVKDLHRGIDIALPEGTEILSGIDGTVTASAYDGSYGNYIVITGANGIEMKYAHCQTLLFAVGQTVTKGDVIATVGNTGTSTGAHLHMEILKDGVYLNPAYFVETFYY
jgi:murein DD-endopeptidase MepM/ murein hydrolase activator NlpD